MSPSHSCGQELHLPVLLFSKMKVNSIYFTQSRSSMFKKKVFSFLFPCKALNTIPDLKACSGNGVSTPYLGRSPFPNAGPLGFLAIPSCPGLRSLPALRLSSLEHLRCHISHAPFPDGPSVAWGPCYTRLRVPQRIQLSLFTGQNIIALGQSYSRADHPRVSKTQRKMDVRQNPCRHLREVKTVY